MDGHKLYTMVQNIKEGLADGNTDVTAEEEAVVFLWDMSERILTERDAAKELVKALQERLAVKYHHDDIHQSRMQKLLHGSTALPTEELESMVAASAVSDSQ